MILTNIKYKIMNLSTANYEMQLYVKPFYSLPQLIEYLN